MYRINIVMFERNKRKRTELEKKKTEKRFNIY